MHTSQYYLKQIRIERSVRVIAQYVLNVDLKLLSRIEADRILPLLEDRDLD